MKSEKLLNSFTKYCEKHPDLRFWQSLAGWSGRFIFQAKFPFQLKRLTDMYYINKRKA